MTSFFDVCPLTEDHLPGVALVEKACFAHPWSEAGLRESLESGHALFLTALEEGEVIGYLGMEYVLDEGSITNVAVLPGKRRLGIASALVGELLLEARKHSLSFVTLEVRESNEPAIKLYRRFGFEPVGRRRDFYRDPREDAVLMTVRL